MTMDKTATNHHHHSKAGNRKIVKYFKRAATFSIPERPGHDRGSSGPMVPLVPAEARQRSQRCGRGGRAFDVDQEPTSPEVSCIGKVKKHKEEVRRLRSMRKEISFEKKEKKKKKKEEEEEEEEEKFSSSSSVLSKIFKGKFRHAEKAAARPPVVPVQAPSIGQMKRFASGRNKVGGFDWKVNNNYGVVDNDHSYSADEREEEEEEEEEEYEISHSGPIVMGGEQKKEVNLWQRRTMKPPHPLQLS